MVWSVGFMRIAIDARGANWYSGTGIGTYTSQIIKYMLQNDKKNSYLLYWWGANYKNLYQENVSISIASKKHRKYFEEYYFPESLKNNSIDIYHVPQNGIGLPSKKSCIYISTIHDLIPYVMPETVGKGYLKRFISAMPQIVQNSNTIITVSEFSKKDIIRIFNVEEDKIKVTPLAAENYFNPMDKDKAKFFLKNKYNISSDFILYVGGFSPRKNVRSILLAFSRIYKNLSKEYKVLILGSANDDHSYLISLCDTLNIIDNVIFTGYVPYEDLPFFYNSCSVFVYPSLYEGFGLPPLEAMSCSVPVITSNLSSIPEVVGDAALLINPFDTEELKSAMETVLEDPVISKKLSEAGYARSKLYSWKKTAEETLKVYKESYEKK
jgi:glycosyltransferase involved in cell wall biosynthesis